MPKIKIRATLTGGFLQYDERNSQLLACEYQRLEGCQVVITLDKERKTRSINQNAYLWGVIIATLNKELGYNDNDSNIHEYLKSKFLSKEIQSPINPSESLTIIRSTNDLNTIEMEEYLTAIRSWASSELNIYLPLPNEVEIN
jgi:hypothetical protein